MGKSNEKPPVTEAVVANGKNKIINHKPPIGAKDWQEEGNLVKKFTLHTVHEDEVKETTFTESAFNVEKLQERATYLENLKSNKPKAVEVKETTFSGHEAYIVTFDNHSDHVVSKDTFDAIVNYLKKEDK